MLVVVEERDGGEKDEDSSQHAAVGETANVSSETTGEIDSKRR